MRPSLSLPVLYNLIEAGKYTFTCGAQTADLGLSCAHAYPSVHSQNRAYFENGSQNTKPCVNGQGKRRGRKNSLVVGEPQVSCWSAGRIVKKISAFLEVACISWDLTISNPVVFWGDGFTLNKTFFCVLSCGSLYYIVGCFLKIMMLSVILNTLLTTR